ncbi:MAG: cell division protein FtsQ/DivIB [Candidatus Binataceae bacterium]
MRRKASGAAAGWNARVGGLVVCAFFALGVMTGFSGAGRAAALRTAAAIASWRTAIGSASASLVDPVREFAAPRSDGTYKTYGNRIEKDKPAAGDAIALVERRDGFYYLDRSGGLSGPVRPRSAENLPILSGAPVADARGATLVDYAATMVRAETALSEMVSEMRVSDDGTATLFLSRARTELTIDPDPERAARELRRAAEVMGQWAGRENRIAALDLTEPGEAIVRLHDAAAANRKPRRSGFNPAVRRPIGPRALQEAAAR